MKENKMRGAKRPSVDSKKSSHPTRSQSALPKVKKLAVKNPPLAKALRTKETDKSSRSPSGKNFLQSSLGAISRSRDDATGAVAEGLGRFAESIGLRKLEDVFDQRVAGALERMGIPTARELARLRERVELLSRQVEDLKLMARK